MEFQSKELLEWEKGEQKLINLILCDTTQSELVQMTGFPWVSDLGIVGW